MITVRDATEQDAAALMEIYNHAVLHTTAIWNEVCVDVPNRITWLRDRQKAGFPVLVASRGDGTVVGYASFGPWRAFEGYRHTVEHSVYVHPTYQRQGIGHILLEALIAAARTKALHVMVAAIEAENTPSIVLHKKLGFEQTGVMKEVGTKFGRWLDLTFMTLALNADQPLG
ncbi:MAG: GNAT family N-acetyltransferase [Acetobacter cibinongensis]